MLLQKTSRLSMFENVALKLAPVLDGIEGEGDFPGDHVTSASEGEAEPDSDGEARHENLLKAIASLSSKEKKKKASQQRSEPQKEVSEFNLSTITDTDQQVGLQDLIGSLQKSAEHGVLKKKLASMQKNSGTLDVPLPTPEVQKIQRTVAFDETSKDIEKWAPTVKKNREAEHLSFPLKPYKPAFPSLKGLAVNFKPRTPLEEEVAAVLRGSSGVLERKNKKLTEQEEEALLAMDLEEAKERRRELQKFRALQSYYEAKCYRMRKIKSKKYHRMKKKAEKRATEKMSKGDLQNEDPELVKEILEKAERLRATERVSLKHRNTSKWARQLIAKGVKNPEAKKLLQDQLRISRTLTKKTEEAASDEEMETPEQGQGMDEDVEELETYGKLFTSEDNPWRLEANEKENSQEIMSPLDYDLSTKLHRPQPVTAQEKSIEDDKESEQSDAERNESEEEFELQPVSHVEKKNGKEGPKKKDKKAANRTEKKKKRKSDLLDGDNTSAPVKKSKKMGKASKKIFKKSAGNDETQNLGQIGEQKDYVKKRKTKNVRRKKAGGAMTLNEVTEVVAGCDISTEENSNSLTMHDTAITKTKDICVDPKKVFQIEDSRTDLDKEPGNLLQQKRIDIQQAFANDDVVDEFVQEKNEIEEASKPKDIDLSLPGWGSWAGAGLRPSEKKKKAFIKKADQVPSRKDKGLSHVIISEEKNKWLAKSQVSSVPYPFNSHLQLERSMRNPIGKHWNTSTTVGQLTKPRVSTLIGTIIEPIKATKDVKQKKPASKKGKTKGQKSSGIAIQNK